MLREPCSLATPDQGEAHQSAIAVVESAVGDRPEIPPGVSAKPIVLIIEDDADNLVLLENILDQFICEIVCLSSGTAALAYALQSPPDLVLLDIWLPDVDGFQVARTLRQHDATQAIPIAAVTALASQRDRELVLRAGCTHYLSKPFLLEDMEIILQQYLELRDA
jgi:CheY-like chemotaxis protein